jgi:putative glutamine amidotransferase
MRTPIIGVTMARSLSESGYSILTITEAYIEALERVGACPILIPLGLAENRLQEILSKVDGLLFSGGGDVHPERYNSQIHPLVDRVDPDRDRVEIYLVNEAIQKEIPFLGICRGLQVINVALGGTIYEDILDQRLNSIRHDYSPGKPRQYLAHTVDIEAESRLAQLLGKSTTHVNSLHHQGIKDLAPNLKVNATASDGLIEAFEVKNYRFGLAVQWHPEWLASEDNMDILFLELARAAGE